MISNQDIEKYKILANNTFHLVSLLMYKIIQLAEANGHKMRAGSQSFSSLKDFHLYSTACDKCDYEVWVCNNSSQGLTMKCEDTKCQISF